MKIRHKIRDLALKFSPEAASQILAWRSQRLIMRIEEKSGLIEASKQFVTKYGDRVLNGPFKGMKYPKDTIFKRNLIPKLIGSYEDELHPWINLLIAEKYANIINVGSADGYYSVGFAIACPDANVTSFDTDPWARSATRQLAVANNVINSRMLSMCTPIWLAQNLSTNSLIIVDCEGFEETLLDPSVAPSLFHADILVELHDHAAPDIESTIRRRFESTHEIRSVSWKQKASRDYSNLEFLSPSMADAALSEGRSAPQEWLLMKMRGVK